MWAVSYGRFEIFARNFVIYFHRVTQIFNKFIQLRYINSWVNSSFISSLCYDRSKASFKASSPHSAIQSFLLQMRVSSPFLKVIQQPWVNTSLLFKFSDIFLLSQPFAGIPFSHKVRLSRHSLSFNYNKLSTYNKLLYLKTIKLNLHGKYSCTVGEWGLVTGLMG